MLSLANGPETLQEFDMSEVLRLFTLRAKNSFLRLQIAMRTLFLRSRHLSLDPEWYARYRSRISDLISAAIQGLSVGCILTLLAGK